MKPFNLSVTRGDNKTWTFEVLDDGVARDISGDFIRFTVKRNKSDADTEALLRFSSTTSGIVKLTQDDPAPYGTLGQFTVTITHAESMTFDLDFVGWYDIQFTLATTEVVTIWMGRFSVPGDVTINSGSIASDT